MTVYLKMSEAQTVMYFCNKTYCNLETPRGKGEVGAYHLCREEPKEEVAVVFFVDSEVPGITLDVGTWQISYQTQLPGCNKKRGRKKKE